MFKTRSEVKVSAEPIEVYSALRDINKWPTIFPPCQNVRLIEHCGTSEIVEITAITKGQSFSWVTSRTFDDESMTISFEQIEPVHPLSRMIGEWVVKANDDAALVALNHEFDVRYTIARRG